MLILLNYRAEKIVFESGKEVCFDENALVNKITSDKILIKCLCHLV